MDNKNISSQKWVPSTLVALPLEQKLSQSWVLLFVLLLILTRHVYSNPIRKTFDIKAKLYSYELVTKTNHQNWYHLLSLTNKPKAIVLRHETIVPPATISPSTSIELLNLHQGSAKLNQVFIFKWLCTLNHIFKVYRINN